MYVLVTREVHGLGAGTERLAMEPAILRIREPVSLNHSLLSFVSALKARTQTHVALECVR